MAETANKSEDTLARPSALKNKHVEPLLGTLSEKGPKKLQGSARPRRWKRVRVAAVRVGSVGVLLPLRLLRSWFLLGLFLLVLCLLLLVVFFRLRLAAWLLLLLGLFLVVLFLGWLLLLVLSFLGLSLLVLLLVSLRSPTSKVMKGCFLTVSLGLQVFL